MGLFFLIVVRAPTIILKLRSRFDGKLLRIGEQLIEYRVHRAGKGRAIGSVSLGVKVPDTMRFVIKRETAFDRFCKSVGLAEEWQTRDEAFDRDVFIVCDDTVLLRALSRNESLRAAVRDLIGMEKGGTLRCSKGCLWVELKTSADKTVEDETVARSVARDALPALVRVRDQLIQIVSGDWRDERDAGVSRQTVLLGISLALGAIGAVLLFISLMPPSLPRQMVVDSVDDVAMLIAGIGGLVLAMSAIFLLRATSRLHWVLLDILLVGIPGIYFASHAATIWQNQHGDRSAGEEQLITVDDKRFVRGSKGGRTYYLSTHGWPDGRVPGEIQVRRWLYESVSPPACLRVRWHRGAFGDPWVSEMEASASGCER